MANCGRSQLFLWWLSHLDSIWPRHRSLDFQFCAAWNIFGHSSNMSKECDPSPSKFHARRTCVLAALARTQLFLLLALTQPSLPSDWLENGLLISLLLFTLDSMYKILALCLPSHSLLSLSLRHIFFRFNGGRIRKEPVFRYNARKPYLEMLGMEGTHLYRT